MDEKPTYPRYFAYGQGYLPLAPYILMTNENISHIVDPGGQSMRAHGGVKYWESRVKEGAMVETTRKAITEQIERWNQFNMPKLMLPD
jgi:hypothetical protein